MALPILRVPVNPNLETGDELDYFLPSTEDQQWLLRKRRSTILQHKTYSGPLHMSPVTGLARLPGRILLSVHMGHFSPVDRDEIQETKPNDQT